IERLVAAAGHDRLHLVGGGLHAERAQGGDRELGLQLHELLLRALHALRRLQEPARDVYHLEIERDHGAIRVDRRREPLAPAARRGTGAAAGTTDLTGSRSSAGPGRRTWAGLP